MKLRKPESSVWVPRGLDEVFDFFANAANLERITPDWLSFRILTPIPIEMAMGTRIDYRLRVHGIPLRWQSEITAWEPPCRFVDEQMRSPYRVWKHEHLFREEDGGTLCLDIVHYYAPGGAVVDKLFVRRDLNRIFHHRRDAIRRLFGPPQRQPGEDEAGCVREQVSDELLTAGCER